MFDDGRGAVVVDVEFDAAHTLLEVFDVALDFGGAGELVAREVGVVRAEAVVVVEGVGLLEGAVL